MAYGSNYYTGTPLNNYPTNVYTPYTQTIGPVTNPNNQGIIWVQGEAGAKAAYVAPGSSGLFMDSEEPVFYIKTVDASGMPKPLRIFDFTERIQDESSDRTNSIPYYLSEDALDKRISDLIDKKMSNGEKKGSSKK